MRPTIFILLFCIIVAGCNLLPQRQPAKKIVIAPEITGSWKLLFLKGIDSSGRIHYPYDREIEGIAFFDSQHNFAIQYYDANRTALSNRDPYYCSDAEIRIAFLSGASFFGNYNISGDTLILNIRASGNPNMNFKREKRYYELRGDSLLIVAPARKLNGVIMQEHSIWKRSGK